MDSPVVIDQYASGDLEACRALWVELTEWHREIYESPNIGGDDPGRQFDEHLERVGASNLWVARDAGHVVGLVGLIPGEGQTARESELEPIVVSRSHRGRGVGRRLAEVAIEAARSAGAVQFKVRPVARNEQAIRFFHAMGFTTLGHLDLFMDFRPAERQSWIDGPTIADRNTKC